MIVTIRSTCPVVLHDGRPRSCRPVNSKYIRELLQTMCACMLRLCKLNNHHVLPTCSLGRAACGKSSSYGCWDQRIFREDRPTTGSTCFRVRSCRFRRELLVRPTSPCFAVEKKSPVQTWQVALNMQWCCEVSSQASESFSVWRQMWALDFPVLRASCRLSKLKGHQRTRRSRSKTQRIGKGRRHVQLRGCF